MVRQTSQHVIIEDEMLVNAQNSSQSQKFFWEAAKTCNSSRVRKLFPYQFLQPENNKNSLFKAKKNTFNLADEPVNSLIEF